VENQTAKIKSNMCVRKWVHVERVDLV